MPDHPVPYDVHNLVPNVKVYPDGLDEIVWWVLGWSGRAKVLAPEELCQMVVEKLKAAIEMNSRYQNLTTDPPVSVCSVSYRCSRPACTAS